MTTPLPAEEPTDGALIAAWRGGDESAAARLVHRHGRALARYLAGAGAVDDLEDVVQETFIRAFRRIETFEGRASFRTWLMTIGSNVLKDTWRKKRRRPVVPLDDREIVDESVDPHGDAVAEDMVSRLGDCVAQLPPMQRDVFLLRAQQEMSYGDIAAALETSSGAARVHYHHAVRRLKKMLG